MKFSIIDANTEIMAKVHNPSIASKDWLQQKEIITEKINDFANTPVFSLAETDDFIITIDSKLLKIATKKVKPETINKMLEMIDRYTSELPETPYTELLFNFAYEVTVDPSYLKELFVKNDKLFKSTFSDDYKVGGAIDFQFDKFLVTLYFIPEDEKISIHFVCRLELKNQKDIKTGLKNYFKLMDIAEKSLGRLFK